jgi:protein-ribulosamine 3-kinase
MGVAGKSLWESVADEVARATGSGFRIDARQPVGGGSISTAYLLEGGGRRYFVKLNTSARAAMFEAESEGLREIARTGTVRVPEPICTGSAAGSAYLVLEYLDLQPGTHADAARLGERLAALHRVTAEHYGWRMDNAIGSTPQLNHPAADWAAFWRERRLGYQLALAARNGYAGKVQSLGERLMGALDALFADHQPAPALLHGDLWSGNVASDRGEPVVFDPAVYYGDREADIAMTELFGGFASRFYEAYRGEYPLDPGYSTRKYLYNAYHLLNHVNLFGGAYLAQAQGTMERLLSEI